MAERKLYRYVPDSDEASKWYKDNTINGDVYDLLPEKHKAWFVCINSRDLNASPINLGRTVETSAPETHEDVAREVDRNHSLHLYNPLHELIDLINTHELVGRIGLGRSTFTNYTYRRDPIGRALVTINLRWYRVDQLDQAILEAGIAARRLTSDDEFLLASRRASGRLLLNPDVVRHATERRNAERENITNAARRRTASIPMPDFEDQDEEDIEWNDPIVSSNIDL